jgi:hypothetical protein
MELVEAKLVRLTEAWNSYFFKFRFLRKSIKFNEEVATNYFGDIMPFWTDLRIIRRSWRS